MKRLIYLKILLLAVLLCVASSVFAGSDFAFIAPKDNSALAPKDTDVSGGILREIFGRGVFGESSGGFANATGLNEKLLGAAFMMFNSGMLVFGSLMFAYASIVGTIKTATDGEVLGKKWSTVWIPVRYSLGTVLLFPTASGFSLAQMGVIWLAMQGVGIASATWKETLTMLQSDDGQIIAPDVVSPDIVRKAAANILRSEVCIADLNASSPASAGGVASFGLKRPLTNSTGVLTAGEDAISFVWGPLQAGTGVDKDVCGSIIANKGTTITSTGSISNSDLRVMRTAQYNAINAAINVIRANDLPARIAKRHEVDVETGDITKAATAVEPDEVIRAVDQATTAYLREMSGAAEKLKRSYTLVNADFIKKSGEQGWMTAGQWYYQLARVSSDLGNAMRYVGDYKNPHVKENGEPGLDPAFAAMINSYLGTATRMTAATTAPAATSTGVNVGVQTGIFIDDGIGGTTKWVAELLGYDVNQAAHPIVQLKNVGDYIMGTIQSIYAIKTVTETYIGAMPGGGAFGKVIESAQKYAFLGSLTQNLLSPLFYVFMLSLVGLFIYACVLSLYLPLVPFVIWIGSILGWLTSIFEMMVAVPLWIAAQLHPEGENLAGKWGANGYMILLEVVMRPTLMVFGLLGAFVICEPFMRFLVTSFWNAAGSVQAESVHGLPSLAIVVAVFVTLGVTMMNRMFALIHIVPNTVMRWLGGMGSSHDRSEQDQSNVYAAVTRVGTATQGSIAGVSGAMRRRESSRLSPDQGQPSEGPLGAGHSHAAGSQRNGPGFRGRHPGGDE